MQVELGRAMDDSELIAGARNLRTVIAEGDDEGDSERRRPDRLAQAMAEAGLYRTAYARIWGGHEAHPITAVKVIEAVAEADGSAGWNLMASMDTSGPASGYVNEQ